MKVTRGPGAADRDELGLGRLGVLVLGLGRHDQFAVADAALGEVQLDHALGRVRIALHDRPVGLLGLALGERARQTRRGGRGLAQQQHAGGVAVQAVDQLGPVDALAPGAEQLVDVVGGLGAALHGQAGGLVQRQDFLVLVQHQRLGEGDVALGQFLLGVRIGRVGQRRHAHLRCRPPAWCRP
jgi:hypothetical protein